MSDRVKLALYCPGCLPGYHLPYLAAAEDGLFSEYDLDVELQEPAPGAENVKRVAGGGSDFCLTSVGHYLRARAEDDDLPARYAGVVVQRSPMAGLVAESSPIAEPADLSGRRLGGQPDAGLVREYRRALDHLGLAPPEVVPLPYGEAQAALGRGEVDAVADYVDLVPRTRRQAGVAVRAVPFGLPFYSSGLVAADRMPDDVVDRVRRAMAAALERQRAHPETGLDALRRRYPDADPADAVEGWSIGEPRIFTEEPLLSMDPDRWAATVAHTAAAHGVPAPPATSVYRPDLADLPLA